MTRTSEKLPDTGTRVLVFDRTILQWKIGRIENHMGTVMWVFDPRIYCGINNTQFDWWQPLPDNPNP